MVALALEGGGALGLAHIGVIKVIEELGIPVDIVTGTSMGAIVGGLYAIGYGAEELKRIAVETDWGDLFSEGGASRGDSYSVREDRSRYFAAVGLDRLGIKGSGGLLRGYKILTFLDALTSVLPTPLDFDQLPRRFRAVATDITRGEAVVLGEGSLSEAIRASMGIPGVFAPYPRGGAYLVDGGLVDNLPIGVARSLGADIVIAVDPRGGFLSDRDVYDRTPLESLSRAVDTMVRANVARQLPGADLVIPVDLNQFSSTDFAGSEEIIARGEAAARALRKSLLGLRERSGEASGTPPAAPKNPTARLIVSGGSVEDRETAARVLKPFENPASSAMERTAKALELYDNLASDGIRLERGADGILRVGLSPSSPPASELRMGISYAGTYSNSVSSKMIVTTGAVFRGWPFRGSELSVNTEALGALGAETVWTGKLSRFFSLSGYFSVRRDYDTLSLSSDDASSVDYLFYKTTSRAGASFGVFPYPGFRLSAGIARHWNDDSVDFAFLSDLRAGDVTMMTAELSALRVDCPVFPMKGTRFSAVWNAGLPLFGASGSFSTLETAGAGYLPVAAAFSIGLLWRMGLDFAGTVEGENAAPLLYKPDLSDRRLFPNPLNAEQQFGAYVAGFGAEAKARLGGRGRSRPFPVFASGYFSSGGAFRGNDSDRSPQTLHWSGGAGLGARFNEGFGLLVRLGGSAEYRRGPVPFLAVDIGSIGY